MDLEQASMEEIVDIVKERIRNLHSADLFVKINDYGDWAYEKNATITLLKELTRLLKKQKVRKRTPSTVL